MGELGDMPNLTSLYCPGCDPERDPIREVLTVRWCDEHQPKYEGVDDEKATIDTGILVSAGEAEAETNRPWCELLHRILRGS